jgi:hypothetical protein
MPGFDVALANVHRIEARLDRSARNIAGLPLDAGQAAGDTVSLSDEMVALMNSRTTLGATAALIRTEADMEKNLLDVFA